MVDYDLDDYTPPYLGYREFGPDFPCPIWLLPAKEGSDTIPKGAGFLHVRAPVDEGYLAVRVFYHPQLRTTVVNEHDLLRTMGRNDKDFKSERLQKYYDAGTWTFTGSHYVSKARKVVVHGVLMAGKCYTHELIPVDHDAQIPM